MIVKTLLTGLFMAVLFASCNPNADKEVGNSGRFNNANTGGSGSAGGSGAGNAGGNSAGSSGTPTDAPLDGGLGILLLAGTAYGVKRVREAKSTRKEK